MTLTSSSRWLAPLASFSVALAITACSGDPPPNPTPPIVTAEPTTEPTAAPTAEPTAAPTAEPTASPTASATADPGKRAPSGRPAVVKEDDKKIEDTFGLSPGAKLVLGGEREPATLKIPEYALDKAINLTFEIDTKDRKSFGMILSKIYKITPVIPPAADGVSIPSSGDPFVLMIPAGKNKDANLAVGEYVKNAAGAVVLKWRVIAPERIDDATNIAQYKLPVLPFGYVHITNKPANAE